MYHRPGAGRPSHSTSCGASPTFSTPRRTERYALSPETLIVNVSVGIPAEQNDAANPHTARPREMRRFIGLFLVPDNGFSVGASPPGAARAAREIRDIPHGQQYNQPLPLTSRPRAPPEFTRHATHAVPATVPA